MLEVNNYLSARPSISQPNIGAYYEAVVAQLQEMPVTPVQRIPVDSIG